MARGNYDKIKNKFLTCEVCSEEYDEGSHTPRLLPCLHTFCSECIVQLITQRSGNDILCPLDRNKHVIVSEKGVDTFPKDNTRRDLLEFIGSDDKSKVKCKECTDNNNAIYRCINCAAFLCTPCYHAHKRTRFTRDHRIVRLEDLQNNPGLFNESIHEGFCRVPGHETVQLKLYCAAPECSKPICQICAASVHRDCAKHDVKDIIEVYKEKKISLQLLQRNVKYKIPQMNKEKERIERKTRILQEDWEQIMIEIQNAFDICISKLEAKKKHMINIAKKKIKSKEEILKNQIKSLQNQIKELEEGYQFTEETLLYRDAAGLLEIESVIQKRLQHLQIQESETTKDINIDFGFQKNEMIADFESYCNNMGYIVSLKVDPATSKKHIPGITEESTYLRQGMTLILSV